MSSVLGGVLGSLGGGQIGKASVDLVLNTQGYQAQLAKSEAETKGSTSSMAKSYEGLKVAGAVAVAAVAVGLARLGAASIQAASDLNESINKAKVVFGDASGVVADFAKTSAASFGISEQAALEAAASYGNMLQSAGLTKDRAAEMSVALVKLAADMASFNNVDPTETLAKLQSGLAGQARPLRVFGVLLSETRVKEEAYRDGIAKVGSVLTDAQKVQARYNIIMKDTNRQHGDFARTAEGLANQQRILNAEWDDAKAKMGEGLVPAIGDTKRAIIDLMPWIGKGLTEAFKGAATVIDSTATGLDTLTGHLEKAPTFIGHVAQAFAFFYPAAQDAADGVQQAAEAMDQGSAAALQEYGLVEEVAKAHEKAAKAATEQKQAEDALAGDTLSFIAALKTLRDDQQKVIDLQNQHKRGTREYSDAVFQVVQDQNSMNEALKTEVETLSKAHGGIVTVREVIQGLGREAGLSKGDIATLWDSLNKPGGAGLLTTIRDLIREIRGELKAPLIVNVQAGFHGDFSKVSQGAAIAIRRELAAAILGP